MPTLKLNGCAPVPIAHYLKALGILRLVAEQRDASALGSWKGNIFELTSTLDREALLKFFLDDYQPTPIIAPWNGGSGFFFREEKSSEKDPATGKLMKSGVRNQPTAATRAIATIEESKADRLAGYANTVMEARQVLKNLGLESAPKEEEKATALASFRAILSDAAVKAFDATIVLTGKGPAYPPLFGTGGTDGNLDFTCNFVQRVLEVIDVTSGVALDKSERWLVSSLYSSPSAGVTTDAAIGQFFPGAAGGVNTASGFDGPGAVNPWDYILMIEGALIFAAATAKRLESSDSGQLVYPFSVRAVGVGYGSSSVTEEADARGELWLPIWEHPTSISELSAVFSEGRAQVAGRPARNAVDFSRAVASLGVDRGIAAFQRYAFNKRNGKNFYAMPLERVMVRRNPLASQLLGPIDDWLEKYRRASRGDVAPSSVQRAARALEAAIISFCKTADAPRIQELLIALGGCEAALAGSWKWTRVAFLSPVPLLAPQWMREANTGTVEFRLAAALASVTAFHGNKALPLRCHLEPVHPAGGREKRWFSWTEMVETNVVWREGDLADVLNAILARRVMLAGKSGAEAYCDSSVIPARAADIAAFIEGRTDDGLLIRLLWGMVLIDFGGDYSADFKIGFPSERRDPPALYALLKLCFSRHELRGTHVPLVPAIHQRARTGDGLGASMLAARRLRASGLAPAIDRIPARGASVTRTAAALLFPLNENDLGEIAGRVLRTTEPETQPATATL